MTDTSQTTNIAGQRLLLLPQKAIYWPKKKSLLVADLHIGKSAHFRKHGIAVPTPIAASNLDNLATLIDRCDVEHLMILGDLFHSKINQEWNLFVEWRKNYSSLKVSLVIGNHDILEKEKYHSSIIRVFKKTDNGTFSAYPQHS